MAQEIDQIAAVKASLEMMLEENKELIEHYEKLKEQLTEMEALEPKERIEKFKKMEKSGAFQHQGLDIRHFGKKTTRSLPPKLFVARTTRRLENTSKLIYQFMQRGILDDAMVLRKKIEGISNQLVNTDDTGAVLAFKAEVDELRDSPAFNNYQSTKMDFIHTDPEIKTEAAFISTKEAVENNEEEARFQKEELETLEKKVNSQTITPYDAQAEIEKMEAEEEQAKSGSPEADLPEVKAEEKTEEKAKEDAAETETKPQSFQ